jgi:hypothetical protein
MILLSIAMVLSAVADAPPTAVSLSRRYRDGERLQYLMRGRNNDQRYEVRLTADVKRRPDGQFVEEYRWSDLVIDDVAQVMTAGSQDFRQVMTLGGGSPFTFPDLAKVQPALIGPVTDLLTFYADLFLASHAGQLRKPGDRFFFASPMVSSWADGARVLIGEDSIDFDIRLTRVDQSRGAATLVIKHIPPERPKIRIPAEWMRKPVGGVPNNWVQVMRKGGAYIGSAGKETFDVELTVGLSGGEILSATMDNVVEAVERECADAQLSDCGEPRPDRTVRRIEMSLSHTLR